MSDSSQRTHKNPGATRTPLLALAGVLAAVAILGLSQGGAEVVESETNADRSSGKGPRVVLSEAQWRRRLSPEEFRILRQEDTERRFANEYHDHKAPGVYVCAGCGAPLFSSEAKYDSGTGWPSYYEPIDEEAVGRRADHGLFSSRTEVHCRRCEGHLGHVFDDGPAPTGLRYCVNSASLDFHPTENQ